MVMHDPEKHEFCLVQYYDLRLASTHAHAPAHLVDRQHRVSVVPRLAGR